MSVTFTTSDWYDRAEAWDYNSVYTVSCWVKPTSGEGISLFSVGVSADTNNGEAFDQRDTAPPKFFETEVKKGGVYDGADTGSTAWTANTWIFIAIRRESATALQLYVDTGPDGSPISYDVTGRTASNKFGFPTWFDFLNGAFAGSMTQVRIWTTNLTNGELATEKQWTVAQKTANLWAEYKLVNAGTATTDNSGNSRTLTTHGSPTTGADDPSGQSSPGSGGGLMWLY